MEAPAKWSSDPVPADLKRRCGADLGLVLVLLISAVGIHLWLARHTVVMSRDGIGFITYAWQLEHQPWAQAMRQNAQHPLYPLAITVASWPVRHLSAGSPMDVMVASAQLVSGLCGVLLVVPMYFLARILFRRSVGFWAALLFQCFPIGARATADALSEGLFLLLVACALLAAVHAVRRNSWPLFALCGLLSGLAYLTRPEGAVVAAAAGAVVVVCQLAPAWRQPWRRALACTLGLCVGAALVAVPYAAVTGRLTGKETARESVGLAWTSPARPSNAAYGGKHLLAVTNLAVFLEWGSQHRPAGLAGFGLDVWCLATELDRGFHHVAWVFALLGLWWFRAAVDRAGWVLLIVCVLQIMALCGLVFVVGYLADRHVLILVLCGLFWAVAAVEALPGRLRQIWQARSSAFRLPGVLTSPICSVLVLLALALSGLPKTLQPLHPQRAGHRTAGEWLAKHVRQGDMVEDPYSWAQYYSGWDFGLAPGRSAGDTGWNHYIVVEKSSNPHIRLSLIKDDIVQRGSVVFRCPLRPDKHTQDEVEIRTINFTRTAVKPPAMRNIP